MLAEQAADRHRQVAGAFTGLVQATSQWEAPAPVAGWVARDVVRHLTDWLPGFLRAGAGIDLARGPAVSDDPVGCWQVHSQAVQALLDDPDTANRTLTNPHLGDLPLDRAVSQFYITDVFLHTWDLARATGQPDRLDADFCGQLLAGMQQMEDAMRSSGQYGPRVPVPDDADVQAKLLGFIGRDPFWTPTAEQLGSS